MHSISFVVIYLFMTEVKCYYPVICISGLADQPISVMENSCKEIAKVHPGTKVEFVSLGTPLDGAKPLWEQIEKHNKTVGKLFEKYPNGVHLVCYSLGGIIGRSIIEITPNHVVRNFISINSPHMGIDFNGPCTGLGCVESAWFWRGFTPKVKFVYTTLTGKTRTSSDDMKHNAKKQPEFYTDFLPRINNLIRHENYEEYKKSILKLNKIILIGSNADGMCNPWQSAQGGFYDKNYNIVPLEKQVMYLNDTLGFKTMAAQGRLKRMTLNGGHLDVVLKADSFHSTVTTNLD